MKTPTPKPAPIPIYDQYFQKSYAFLFPLLELARREENVFLPDQTYLRLKGLYKEYDRKLIVSYKNLLGDAAWDAYQQKFLLTHPLLDSTTPTKSGKKQLYIFDLTRHQADVDLFLRGRYSQLSAEMQKRICTHYGVQTPEWAHLEGFLHPESAFARYATLLGVDEELLRERGELCAPFEAERETLSVELPDDFVEQLVLM